MLYAVAEMTGAAAGAGSIGFAVSAAADEVASVAGFSKGATFAGSSITGGCSSTLGGGATSVLGLGLKRSPTRAESRRATLSFLVSLVSLVSVFSSFVSCHRVLRSDSRKECQKNTLSASGAAGVSVTAASLPRELTNDGGKKIKYTDGSLAGSVAAAAVVVAAGAGVSSGLASSAGLEDSPSFAGSSLVCDCSLVGDSSTAQKSTNLRGFFALLRGLHRLGLLFTLRALEP